MRGWQLRRRAPAGGFTHPARQQQRSPERPQRSPARLPWPGAFAPDLPCACNAAAAVNTLYLLCWRAGRRGLAASCSGMTAERRAWAAFANGPPLRGCRAACKKQFTRIPMSLAGWAHSVQRGGWRRAAVAPSPLRPLLPAGVLTNGGGGRAACARPGREACCVQSLQSSGVYSTHGGPGSVARHGVGERRCSRGKAGRSLQGRRRRQGLTAPRRQRPNTRNARFGRARAEETERGSQQKGAV